MLDARVEVHDDGSVPGMHDLDIHYSDGRIGAVEVTAAADQAAIEFWKLINGGDERWIEPQLTGGWAVSAWPYARATRLRTELPSFLQNLEKLGVPELRLEPERQRTDHPLVSAARDLGISHAIQGPTSYPGSIYITVEQTLDQSTAMIGYTGDPLADWIGEFLAAPKQRDVCEKLARSGAEERHAFVLMPGFTPAPYSVAYLVIADNAPLPERSPHLPEEITHVWVMSMWDSGQVVRWSPDLGWSASNKRSSVQ